VSNLIVGTYNGVFLVLLLALEVLKIFAAIDAAVRPASAYVAAGKQTKVFWVVLLVVAALMFSLGLFGLAAIIAAVVYLVDVRPAVRDASRGGSQGGWYR
jgi:uncharacterized protein DUF2516